jgi:hypothetical protein
MTLECSCWCLQHFNSFSGLRGSHLRQGSTFLKNFEKHEPMYKSKVGGRKKQTISKETRALDRADSLPFNDTPSAQASRRLTRPATFCEYWSLAPCILKIRSLSLALSSAEDGSPNASFAIAMLKCTTALFLLSMPRARV